MTRSNRSFVRIRQQGQTLIIALIVMGVLLILGLVFLGLINRNILNAVRSQRRSEASDLAEAGIRYAHGQLVSSPLGADWRGAPTPPSGTATDPDSTFDPDVYYTRPGSGPNDLGGPDMLGPFVRIPFAAGRALVRVRYGATDATPTPAIPGGPLRHPGAARSSLIIEAVGRPGVINSKDPTTLNTEGGLRFQNFSNITALMNSIGAMAKADAQISTSRRLVAFAPIGIIDAARFETNKYNSSAPIEIGIADGLGVTAFDDAGSGGIDVGSLLELQLGTAGAVQAGGKNPSGFGSMIINGDAKFYGHIVANLNTTLGDSIRVSGRATGGNNAQLIINTSVYDTALGNYRTITPPSILTAGAGASFDSQNPNFSTASGTFLDGSPRTDADGYPSGVGRLVPPSALTIDPQTKLNRYVTMTRESGTIVNGNNSGAFGYGQGIYVNNASDRQEPTDSEGRKSVGSQRSLFDDWLNPNSTSADSGWKGPFYIPVGAQLQLLPDGWSIQRDATGPDNEKWKTPGGANAGTSTVRYRVGMVPDGSLRTLNSVTFAGDINGNLTQADFINNGMPFNGVLYFEGNVRVRGTIPTDVQLTVVSGATVYIEGSIVKGTTANNVTTANISGGSITALPLASLMLMAKDNVAVNTTMFFGPDAKQALESKNDLTDATGISSVILKSSGGVLTLLNDLILDPVIDTATGAANDNPSTWRPYAMNYKRSDVTSASVPTQLLLGLTMDEGDAAVSSSFVAMNVNSTAVPGDSAFYFDAEDGLITNTAYAYYNGTLPVPGKTLLYGLGAETWQHYSHFELRNFTLFDPATATYSGGFITPPAPAAYRLFAGINDVTLRPGGFDGVATNDTLIGRSAVTPSQVKIEASVFAEEGSFFVIPGPWFSPNPNDLHSVYDARVSTLKGPGFNLPADQAVFRASRERLENFGAAPYVPFYGEPLDIRVSIVGSVSENLPPPISVQSEWVRKWGWIPRKLGATGVGIPIQHTPFTKDTDANGYLYSGQGRNFVPNLTIQYDPVLATGRTNPANPADQKVIRRDAIGRPLPPMPRLPVSPQLSYFGEL